MQTEKQHIYVIFDDTICSKTIPSSKAKHPIEAAYFHFSHLKKKQDYGHQAVAVLLSCNKITLPYEIIMYDKSVSKINIVKQIAEELPAAPISSYFLCDSLLEMYEDLLCRLGKIIRNCENCGELMITDRVNASKI